VQAFRCSARRASSMIFKATTRVAGSSINFIPNFQHMVSRASDICRTTSGSNAWPERNPRIGMIGSYKSSPRLLHAESYESEDHVECDKLVRCAMTQNDCSMPKRTPDQLQYWSQTNKIIGDKLRAYYVCVDNWARLLLVLTT
jgi:hypothetical protein